MISLYFVVVVITVLVYRLWLNRRLIRLHRLIPSSYPAWPFIGHLYMMIGNDKVKMKAIKKFSDDALKQGGITSVWLFSRLQVVITDPILAEIVLKNCLEKDDLLEILRIFTGGGSIFAPVKTWRSRRRKIVRVFNIKNLKQFIKIIGRQSNVMVDQLRSLTNSGSISIVKYLKKTSLCTVYETALGIQISTQEESIIKAIGKCIRKTCYLLFRPPFQYEFFYKNLPMWPKFLMEREIIYGFINSTVSLKQKTIQENIIASDFGTTKNSQDLPEKLPTVLDILMKPNNAGTLSDVELCEEILVMIFAGTETMSVALSLVCVMLSKHPDEQEKVYQELKDIFGDETKQPTMDELLRLKYLEAVIKETLRMYPPGPIIMRKADKDLMLPSGITLVKGCGIVVSTWGIHRNPAYWGSDVEKFRPDRFLNDPPTHPASFLPFSYGPRNCVGQQYSLLSMKITLSTLLRYYRILPEGSSSGTGNMTKDDKPLRCKYNVILNHVDNYIVELVARI